MGKTIDCLFIGHNNMNFADYESAIKKMGVKSGAYRNLNLDFIQYDNKLYPAADVFNLFYCSDTRSKALKNPFGLGEIFSAAIAYLGSYLHRRGFTFDYVNSFQGEKEELRKKLEQDHILTIAVTTTLYVTPLPILEIIDFIKKHNNTAKIIVGGPFVTTRVRFQGTRYPELLEYPLRDIDADFFVNSSQGEAALVNIIKALKMNTSFDQVQNILYKTGKGYVVTVVSREDNRLSENMVKWDLFSDRIGEFVNIRTAISCPFSCAFCGFQERAGKYQVLAVEEVERELNLLDKIPTVKHLDFIDDTFNVPQKRFKEILRMMIRNNYKFKWYSHFRCQYADREMVELMKESGCEGVFLGIESGNDEILRNMNKAVTVEKYLKGIQLLKEHGILAYGSFIIGFPGETNETVEETVKFVEESGLDFFRAQIWYGEPTTPIFNKKEQYKIEGESFEWSHMTMDSKRASDIVEGIFLSVEEPVWVPQYNFEFDGLFHLFHRGKTPDQVKRFLRAFNAGIEEKLKEPSREEVSFKTIRQIKEACVGNDNAEPSAGKEENILTRYNADFDF
jgi:radical SAM PhpK family P-methyltransferase